MDPFTLTDAAGTFAFDGTQGVFTSADGSTTITFTNSASSTTAPAATPTVASVAVSFTDGSSQTVSA